MLVSPGEEEQLERQTHHRRHQRKAHTPSRFRTEDCVYVRWEYGEQCGDRTPGGEVGVGSEEQNAEEHLDNTGQVDQEEVGGEEGRHEVDVELRNLYHCVCIYGDMYARTCAS